MSLQFIRAINAGSGNELRVKLGKTVHLEDPVKAGTCSTSEVIIIVNSSSKQSLSKTSLVKVRSTLFAIPGYILFSARQMAVAASFDPARERWPALTAEPIEPEQQLDELELQQASLLGTPPVG